jgi:NDP-sugar pyrophosphorylase family protein
VPLINCVREHSLLTPYGVAEISDHRLDRLIEQPIYRCLVNSGIYACNPEITDLAASEQPTTVVDIAHILLGGGPRPAEWPIHAAADHESIFG